MTTVVVTGGAGEIGRRLVAAWAADGCRVHVVDVDPAARDVASAQGGVAHVLDLRDPAALGPLEGIDRVDVLVNGVGTWPTATFDELDPATFSRLVDVNLTTAYAATWACRTGLRAARGAVVNVTSAIGLKGHARMLAYAAAKAGLIGLTRSLALALGADGVRVNAVAPGLVDTGAAARTWTDDERAAFRASRALGTDLEAEDVVAAVRYLASGAARTVTGQTLVVDGGTVLH